MTMVKNVIFQPTSFGLRAANRQLGEDLVKGALLETLTSRTMPGAQRGHDLNELWCLTVFASRI